MSELSPVLSSLPFVDRAKLHIARSHPPHLTRQFLGGSSFLSSLGLMPPRSSTASVTMF